MSSGSDFEISDDYDYFDDDGDGSVYNFSSPPSSLFDVGDAESSQTVPTSTASSLSFEQPSDHSLDNDNNSIASDANVSDSHVSDADVNAVIVDSSNAEVPSNNDNIDIITTSPFECFRSEMRNNDGEPPTKCARIESNDDDVGDGQSCPICFDSWTSSGEHRLASLKCGHLFGKSCIVRWLRPRENRVCPTCKLKATEKDIRLIYAKSISFVDNSEVENYKIELEKAKASIHTMDLEVNCLKTLIESQHQKIAEQEAQINLLKNQKAECSYNRAIKNWNFSLMKNIEITKDGGCRVFAYNKHRNSLFISQHNSNSIFPGCSIREIDCETFNVGKAILLHQKEIRDVAYSDHHNLVMSVSFDKKVKIFASASELENISIQTDVALWCGSWDICEPNRLCVGGAGGNIMLYDIRQTKACLSRVHDIKDSSPILSLTCMSDDVISCSLNSLQIHHKEGGENFRSENFNVSGPFYDMNYDFSSKILLLSTRPNVSFPFCKHESFSFDFKNHKELLPLKSFRGAGALTQMTKSSQFHIGEEKLFSLYSETEDVINIWNITADKRAAYLPCRDLIIDTCNWKNGSDMFLAGLSNNKTKIYKLRIENL